MAIEPPESAPPARTKIPRDWFGYFFTIFIGFVLAILLTWYQLYVSQKEATSAELERFKSVKQIAVAIVEEHVLNGKKLEIERLTRLIDQRRRDESISLPISITEVVEQGEFNIENSHYLSMDKKEEIKPIFDAFYADLKSRSFQPFTNVTANSDLLNDIAKKIQDGKSTDALEALGRLEEAHAKDLLAARSDSKLSILDAARVIISTPSKAAIFILGTVLYFWFGLKYFRPLMIRLRRGRPYR